MTPTHLEVLDHAVHEANVWLGDLMQELGTDDRREAWSALKGALHALRDRIGPAHAVRLGAQLPLLVRGVFYEGFRLAQPQSRERRVEPFLEHVERDVHGALTGHPERAVKAVFALLSRRIDPAEAAKLLNLFPGQMRRLWPAQARDASTGRAASA